MSKRSKLILPFARKDVAPLEATLERYGASAAWAAWGARLIALRVWRFARNPHEQASFTHQFAELLVFVPSGDFWWQPPNPDVEAKLRTEARRRAERLRTAERELRGYVNDLANLADAREAKQQVKSALRLVAKERSSEEKLARTVARGAAALRPAQKVCFMIAPASGVVRLPPGRRPPGLRRRLRLMPPGLRCWAWYAISSGRRISESSRAA